MNSLTEDSFVHSCKRYLQPLNRGLVFDSLPKVSPGATGMTGALWCDIRYASFL